jgi:Protein of unknown function (DUF3467)
MTNTPKAKLPSGQVVQWKEKEHPTVYANIMGFSLSPFDIGILFGELGESTPTLVNGIPNVKVVVSPEQAANLAKLLNVAIAAYVENYGPLRTAGAINLDDVNAQLEASKVAKHKATETTE